MNASEKISKVTGKTVGMGILSWRGHVSLAASLKTYAEHDLYALFDDGLIFLPEADDDVRTAAAPFVFRVEEQAKNLGILDGMEQIATRLDTDYILFLENDCPCIVDHNIAASHLTRAVQYMTDMPHIKASRFRHRQHPGEPFDGLTKYYRYHPRPQHSYQDHIKASMRRLLRPAKAHRLIGTSVHGSDQPHVKFPNDIKALSDGFYAVKNTVLPWSNLLIMVEREFFLSQLLPAVKALPFQRGPNGYPALEIELNRSDIWRRENWQTLSTPGIFTHKRLDERGY